MADSMGVGVFHFVFAGRREPSRDRLDEHLALNRLRAAPLQAHSPESDVVVVSPPIRHGAAGIFEPVTEPEMAALRLILASRGLTLPEVPVELGGYRGALERTP